MTVNEDVEGELDAMLDDGVTVQLVDGQDGRFQLKVLVDETACEECLVPDSTLSGIVTDALERRGARVASVSVLRADRPLFS